MDYGYYMSPIGALEICINKDELISLGFVEKMKGDTGECILITNIKKQLDEYFQGTRKKFDIKLNLSSGTEFQNKVWSELLNIPYGNTVSYKEVAQKIGNEKAVRAVGGANNKNPIAIIVPCHRVIGANKKLVGYNGGIDKKIWLLNHEC